MILAYHDCDDDCFSLVRKVTTPGASVLVIHQCDQMAAFFQYLVIYSNENVPNCIRTLPKVAWNFTQILN